MGLRHPFLPGFLCVSSALLASADYGNMFNLGPWSSEQPSDPYITNATYSLTVPGTLTDYSTSDTSIWVAIWVGVQPNVDDAMSAALVQPLLNWCMNNADCGCDGDGWCVAASTYTPDGQVGNAYVAVDKGDVLDFAIWLEDNKVYQSVSRGGEVLSSRSDSGFLPGTIYGANECSTDSCGVLESYSWDNMVLTFSSAISDDLNTYTSGVNSTMSTLESSEGGKVWTWSKITIDENVKGAWALG